MNIRKGSVGFPSPRFSFQATASPSIVPRTSFPQTSLQLVSFHAASPDTWDLSSPAAVPLYVIKHFAQLPVLFNDRFGCILDLLCDLDAFELVLS